MYTGRTWAPKQTSRSDVWVPNNRPLPNTSVEGPDVMCRSDLLLN